MKKTLLILSLVLLVSSVGFARRLDNPESKSGVGIMKHGSTFTLYYKASQPSRVKVAIYDATGRLVFSEVIRKLDGFSRPYNFSQLAEGEYTIEVVDNEKRQIEKVNYAQGKVENLINISRVSGTDNKYLLTVPGKANDVVSVKIYGNNNQVLYSQQEAVRGDFAKVYNLSNVKSSVLFTVTDSKGNVKQVGY
ncbi:MAG TPA: hypothetical protein VGK59_10790 [Ohtaekwangia sp.]